MSAERRAGPGLCLGQTTRTCAATETKRKRHRETPRQRAPSRWARLFSFPFSCLCLCLSIPSIARGHRFPMSRSRKRSRTVALATDEETDAVLQGQTARVATESMSNVVEGNCLDRLADYADDSFDCCVTSPPYWGLRDYGVAGQIGAEDSVDAYVQNLVAVFREVRRVLRDRGTLWLNLGDAFTSGGRATRAPDKKNAGREMTYRPPTPPGLKAKDLIGLPWRVAFALQADGWYLRSDIIWHKPNCQPESVRDRPTRAHEYVFLLSKSAAYHYDHEAVREPAASGGGNGAAMRSRRSVWSINTKPYPGAHFATFPLDLVDVCLAAGAPPSATVLDPFCGSGTVGVACRRRGHTFVGIDLNPEYVALARSRIASAADPPSSSSSRSSSLKSASSTSSSSGSGSADVSA
ncbi:Methyltransferase [Pandoravirus salinus]|uniref:site-specific DNA-methyltransferase (cytosine-N(4)-specific) n=1 Tax=Pandoravirus salinus TaxID=1349410 RepID=S4VZJ3_9VIRU|nr:DNA methyltransferase [Pandoravirus salinus]AGO84931.1 Methyltransferase [Pandoravirus salinus]